MADRDESRPSSSRSGCRFPVLKTIEDFSFLHQSTVRLALLGSALAPEFVGEGLCVILSGKPGRGKTHLAVVQPGVLVVDQVGYLTYGTDAANMLFHVVNDRHRKKRAMIFTTNKALTAWGRVLHDEDLAQAILDRVLERGRVLTIEGPSMRTKHLGLDDSTSLGASDQPARISGIDEPEFPEPTVVSPENRLDLILQDLEFVETRLGRNPPDAERVVLEKIKAWLEGDQMISAAGLVPEEAQAVEAHAFVTMKPIVVAEAEDVGRFDEFLVRVVSESGYISFLTAGGAENLAWLIRRGTTAVEAGGAIHTDIQKGFIRAEINSFADMVEAGGETQVKRANKQRLETKNYVMQDCALTNFRFNK